MRASLIKMVLGCAIFILPLSVYAELVNINTASAEAISHYMKGIGDKKAESIVTYRELNGDFESIDDIVNVKGVGEGLLEKNREDMSITEGVAKIVKKESPQKVVDLSAKKLEKVKVVKQNTKKIALKAKGKVVDNKTKKSSLKLDKTSSAESAKAQ